MEDEKASLDAESQRLAAERERLIDEGRDNAAEQGAIAALRSAAQRGPYTVILRGDVIIPGKYNFLEGGRKFSTYEEAIAFLTEVGYEIGDRAFITDVSGSRIESPPADESNSELQEREEALATKVANREAAISSYRSELAQYDRGLSEFDRKSDALKATLSRLSPKVHKPLTSPRPPRRARPAATSGRVSR